jgi:ankyrin repeat protein
MVLRFCGFACRLWRIGAMAGAVLLTAGVAWSGQSAGQDAAQGAPRLVDLVKAGDGAAVRGWLTRHRSDVDQPASDGTTALHWAAQAGSRPLVDLLLASGANPNTKSRFGIPPLWPAVTRGDAGIAAALVKAGAVVDVVLPAGQTLLMLAARTGDVSTLKVLLEAGAKPNAADPAMGETALMWAAAENHGEAITVLAAAGAQVNARSARMAYPKDKFGDGKSARFTVLPRGAWTPLMYAVRQNASDAVRALVAAGADLNAVDPDGTTPLTLAVINAHYDLAAHLLDLGADPNVADNTGMTPLYAVVDMHTLDETPGRPAPPAPEGLDEPGLAARLLAKGARPDAPLKSPLLERVHNNPDGALGEGATPLMRAARKGDLEMMRVLLDGRARVDARTARGATALMYLAGFGGQIRFAEYDLRRATDVEFTRGLAMLVAAGANVNAVDETGQTALHAAAGARGLPVVSFLLEHGARPDVKDKQERTPLDIALGGGRTRGATAAPARADVAAVLRQALGATPAASAP